MKTNRKAVANDTVADELIDEATESIRKSWDTTRRSPHGKQQVLQSIYAEYCDFIPEVLDEVRARLADKLNYRTPEKYHILRLLIEVALLTSSLRSLPCGLTH